jgi:hypothetical protein
MKIDYRPAGHVTLSQLREVFDQSLAHDPGANVADLVEYLAVVLRIKRRRESRAMDIKFTRPLRRA